MTKVSSSLLICLAVSANLCAPAVGVTIGTSLVGNLGNLNDSSTGNLYGGVEYNYRIGATEITNEQYVAFLNAIAASDVLGLYNANMGSDPRGGISRSGASGSFVYATRFGMGNKPVNFVSWYDALRFANWLNNGQWTGDTETGAYTILGGTATPSNGLNITRNSSATWFLPSENEWYKSAYYQPATQGGDEDNYWLYPTASNETPTLATADETGEIGNPGANVANYNHGADWNGQDGNVTTVGGAGLASQSFYGTSDQGGNLWEWNEALIGGSARGLRGGSAVDDAPRLRSSTRFSFIPSTEGVTFGFRVAAVVGPQYPGDVNYDDAVDFTDLNMLLTNYGLASKFATGDFDYSGVVDFLDLNTLLSNYGLHAPVSSVIAPVPEPSSLAVAALGALGVLFTVRRNIAAPWSQNLTATSILM